MFFISWGIEWSQTSNFLQHAWIHWATRGLCEICRSTSCSILLLTSCRYRISPTQSRNSGYVIFEYVVSGSVAHPPVLVDDMFLESSIYHPVGPPHQITTTDLNVHRTWQAGLNTRLPSGSNYFLEFAHNGNGNIIVCMPSSSAS